jgi:hypothetical protein
VIHYSLICDDGHGFDSWFRDSRTYDSQAAAGLVNCPFCQSTSVAKAVMAPSVARKTEAPVEIERHELVLLDERHAQLRAMIRDLREKIISSTEDVGEKFPDEARRIQDGESEPRAIRGQASLEEARALIDEGIEILPIPGLPGEGN